ncbi:hypothetical protein [Mucilaginibacter sp.]|uniref:hypothetical protein n=1 Tax=Mucilaginibacter sp. TaxID=1882438 RepID=UPI0025D8698B|nr:hypothetical protein [Mucilaginibacter sp.]
MKKLLLFSTAMLQVLVCLAFNTGTLKKDTSSFTIYQGSKLLYYVENNSGEKNQFLVPLIETELKKLKDKTDPNKGNLFSEVQSLNLFLSAQQANGTLTAAINIFNKNNVLFKSNKNSIEENKLVVKNLRDKDWFLKININILNNLIEYQFVLFKVGKATRNQIPYLEQQNYRTISVFVDPLSTNYKDKIKNVLRQIITEANEPPIPLLLFQGQVIKDTIFAGRGHNTLTADAQDNDSSPDQLTYKWRLSQTGSLFEYNKSGKNLDLDWDGSYEMNVLLTVSDGVNNNLRMFTLIVRDKPIISIQYPYDNANTDYENNIYHLYSYHRFFKLNDFMGLINITAKTNTRSKNVELSPNFSTLIPEVRVITNTPEKEPLAFSTIKFSKIDEDSISNYKERIIPTLQATETPWQLTDERNLFKFKIDSTKPFRPEKKLIPPYFIHSYTLYSNTRSTQNIKIPTTKSFKITAINRNNQNSEDFQIQFHKVSRLNFVFDESLSLILGKIYGHNKYLISIGAGFDYNIIPVLSIEGLFGGLNPTTSDTVYTNSHSSYPYYYKITGKLFLLNYKNKAKGLFTISYLHRESFSFTQNKQVVYYGYHSRVGLGFSLQAPSSTSYHYEPVSVAFSFSFYPKTDDFTSNCIEAGLKCIVNLRKKQKIN